jgi:uncharacterized tellurite resistance protein B-like protein
MCLIDNASSDAARRNCGDLDAWLRHKGVLIKRFVIGLSGAGRQVADAVDATFIPSQSDGQLDTSRVTSAYREIVIQKEIIASINVVIQEVKSICSSILTLLDSNSTSLNAIGQRYDTMRVPLRSAVAQGNQHMDHIDSIVANTNPSDRHRFQALRRSLLDMINEGVQTLNECASATVAEHTSLVNFQNDSRRQLREDQDLCPKLLGMQCNDSEIKDVEAKTSTCLIAARGLLDKVTNGSNAFHQVQSSYDLADARLAGTLHCVCIPSFPNMGVAQQE